MSAGRRQRQRSDGKHVHTWHVAQIRAQASVTINFLHINFLHLGRFPSESLTSYGSRARAHGLEQTIDWRALFVLSILLSRQSASD